MLTHAGVFSVDFSRIDTGKTVCFLVSGGLYAAFVLFRNFRMNSTAITAHSASDTSGGNGDAAVTGNGSET